VSARIKLTDSERKTIDRLIRFCDRGARELNRYDSATLPLFARQLEQIMAETYEEEFPELRGATDLLPIETGVNEGARTFIFYLFTAVGFAKFISPSSTGSLPRVSLQGAEKVGFTQTMGNEYGWSTQDVRSAQFAGGLQLQSLLASAAKRAHDQLLHDTCLWGREDLGLPGLLNHPNITVTDAANGAGASPLWANKTVDEIIADIRVLVTTPKNLSFNRLIVNRVLMAPAQMDIIKYARVGAGDGSMSILSLLEDLFRGVSFEELNELDDAESDSNLASNSLFAYIAGDKKKASLVVPMPFRQHPVEQRSLEFTVPCESMTGGVKMAEPLMCHRMDGVG
jgi:hypothetical protein